MRTLADTPIPFHATDEKLSTWLKENARDLPATLAMTIGVRSWDGRIYRRITVHGLAEFLTCTRFLEEECQLISEESTPRTGAGGLDIVFSAPPRPAPHHLGYASATA
jgi:hypothetical protein